jgi:hypothetical protein
MARNTLANALFEGDGTLLTHLLMLDADQGFESPDVLKMICADKEVIALPTTVKRMNWERIAQAAKWGANPQELKRCAGSPNFDDLPGATYSTNAAAIEVNKVGAVNNTR